MWFCEQHFKVCMVLDIYGQVSFKLGIVIETTELHILIPVRMTLIFIQGHSCIGK